MQLKLKGILEKENIEYFSVIPFEVCKIVNPRLLNALKFSPKSIIIFLMPYYTGEAVNLSRYAISHDYHSIFHEISTRISDELSICFPSANLAPFCDHSPIDERAAAACAGLGFVGENRLLINEKYGSYVFVGEIITDIDEDEIGSFPKNSLTNCIGCQKCKAACPTKSLENHENECLSAITQRKGTLSDSEVEIMRKINTVWGCDVCQTVCPHNKSPELTPISAFYEERMDILTSQMLSEMTDVQFSQRAYAFRKIETIKRNLQKLGY